jgi:hypothetical protein
MTKEALVGRLEQQLAHQVTGLDDLGVPEAQLVLSPISAELALRARADGRAFYHDELRGFLSFPQGLAPELMVWEEGQTTPVWKDGVLEAPKYFSFFMDTVFSPYTPNHRKKWRIHELMHTLCRFYWDPKMSRFSCYVGSRLSELLPVVHWYGLDEIFRNRCGEHQGMRLYREYCPECEKLARPYWLLTAEQKQELRPLALSHAEHALAHYASEMEACSRERTTGKRHPVHRPKLDSSSDAIGYLRGHWNRLTSWSFGSWIEHFMVDGEDYFSDLEAHHHHQEEVWSWLMSGEKVSQEHAQRNRKRRMLQDMGYRTLQVLESCPDEDVEQEIWPLLEHAAELASQLREQDVDIQDVEQAIDQISTGFTLFFDRLSEELLEALPQLGYLWSDLPKTGLYVVEGLRSGLHDSLAPIHDLPAVTEAFIADPIFTESRELRQRFADWAKKKLPEPFCEGLRLESWLRAAPHRDEEAELFAALPEESWGEGSLRLNRTFRRSLFSASIVAEILGWDVSEGELDLICIWSSEGPQLFELEAEHALLVEQVQEGRLPELEANRADLEGLLGVGVLVWLPF